MILSAFFYKLLKLLLKTKSAEAKVIDWIVVQERIFKNFRKSASQNRISIRITSPTKPVCRPARVGFAMAYKESI